MMMTGDNYDQYRVRGIPNSIYYIPNYISKEESDLITSKIYEAPKPKWVHLKDRRLQNWGGLPSEKTGKMLKEDLPNWLKDFSLKISLILKTISAKIGQEDDELRSISINHVLINEYLSGQGIFAHEDGPFYIPLVATLSLGSSTLIEYIPKANQTTLIEPQSNVSLFLEPNSLVIMTQDLYKNYTHQINPFKDDVIENPTTIANYTQCNQLDTSSFPVAIQRSKRLSLTFRQVKKCVNLSNNLLKLKK